MVSNISELQPVVAEVMRAHDVGGMVVGLARGSEQPEFLCAGTDADGMALTLDSIFPVASITKLATALGVLRLSDQGRVGLDRELRAYLPEAAAAQPGVTIRRLLCHTSGLAGGSSEFSLPYQRDLRWQDIKAACARTPLATQPGVRVDYSAVGYSLLGIVIEHVTGLTFADALATLLFNPLGIEAFIGTEPPRAPVRIGQAEGPYAGTELEPYNSPFWRTLGLPSNGLLTTPLGAMALLRAFQFGPWGLLRPETIAEATRDQTGGLGGGISGLRTWEHCPWGLGPKMMEPPPALLAPPQASDRAFGHPGATGCLAFADPGLDSAWVILGTRFPHNGWLDEGSAISQALYA